MIKTKRIKYIQDYISKNQSASLDELVKKFDVSKNTIRRDVQEIVDEGNFKKVYGGVAVKAKPLESFQDRQVKNKSVKNKIGELAATYIAEGDILFIDSGTTTLELFEYIKEKKLTILTNNIEFIVNSIPYPNLNVISTGGILERETNSFINYQNIDLLQTYNVNKAFMASTGVSFSNGVTNSSPHETKLKQIIIKKASKNFLLIDHSKFDHYGLMTYCKLKDIHCIITDLNPTEEYQSYAKENGIRIDTLNE